MYSSGASESQIRCLTESRNHSASIVAVSLQARVAQSAFVKAGAQESSMAGLVLMIGTDVLPLYFFIILLKIKLKKDT